MYSFLANTSVTLCGCSSTFSPAFIFPSPSTPGECLSSYPSPLPSTSIIRTRFSYEIDTLNFNCTLDFFNNPRQDCFNTLAYICNPTYLGTDPNRIANCKSSVDSVFNLTPQWEAVRRECGQWPYAGYTGNLSSSNCEAANAALTEYANQWRDGPFRSYFTFQLTESLSLGLWTYQALRG